MACTVWNDWSSAGIPGFQGNCYAATNAQIKWLMDNGYFTNHYSTPANNNTCITKTQLSGSCSFTFGAPYTALSNNNLVPIGYIGNDT